MRKAIIIAVALLACSACSFITVNGKSQVEFLGTSGKNTITASSTIIDKEFQVEDFNRISSSGAFDFVYSTGDPYVSISAPDNIMEYLDVRIKDGKLYIETDRSIRIKKLNKIIVTVHSPILNGLEISGAGDFHATTGLTAEDFKAGISGAGNLKINGLKAGDVSIKVSGAGDVDVTGLECNGIDVSISGAGNVTLAGKAESADLGISGAGNINVKDLDCENVSSRISGAGHVSR